MVASQWLTDALQRLYLITSSTESKAIKSLGRVLLCCTDIIESLFGRYKNKGGTPTISADALAISLYSVTITPQLVLEALIATPYKEVYAWEQIRTCENRYPQIRRMEQELKSVAA